MDTIEIKVNGQFSGLLQIILGDPAKHGGDCKYEYTYTVAANRDIEEIAAAGMFITGVIEVKKVDENWPPTIEELTIQALRSIQKKMKGGATVQDVVDFHDAYGPVKHKSASSKTVHKTVQDAWDSKFYCPNCDTTMDKMPTERDPCPGCGKYF